MLKYFILLETDSNVLLNTSEEGDKEAWFKTKMIDFYLFSV